jgi:hypothetical protein
LQSLARDLFDQLRRFPRQLLEFNPTGNQGPVGYETSCGIGADRITMDTKRK